MEFKGKAIVPGCGVVIRPYRYLILAEVLQINEDQQLLQIKDGKTIGWISSSSVLAVLTPQQFQADRAKNEYGA